MVVKVMITRQLQQGKTKAAYKLLNQLRGAAMDQPGYVSGETLLSHDDPRRLVVVATWLDIKHWYDWRDDPGRKVFEAQLDRLLEGVVHSEVFLLGTYPTND